MLNTVQVCNKYNITWYFHFSVSALVFGNGAIFAFSVRQKYWAPQPNTRADTENTR